MIRTSHDACCFVVMGLLLPCMGAAYLYHSPAPLVCWLAACALVVATSNKGKQP